MKIGIVTVHDSNNYGSFLQAYALQKILEEYGHEVYFARTRNKEYLKAIFIPSIVQKRFLKHPFQMIRERKFGKEKREIFLEDQKVFKEIDANDLKSMDVVILGSDEIWNIQVPVFQKDIFYGVGLERVIAYAVSVGRAKKEEVLNYPKIVRNIRNLPKILVRDSQTQGVVEDISGFSPQIVCDPTFLLDKSIYKNLSKAERKLPDKYILVYSYGIDTGLKLKIEQFANENNLKIVSACFYYRWADYNIMCGPLAFCEVMEKATYVITTTFHGTIFSILNEKQFVSLPASIKTKDLLEKLGLKGRIIDNNSVAEEISRTLKENKIDYERVKEIIRKEKENSLKLLLESIENVGNRNEDVR